jgi:hypothetical protein
MAAVVSASQIFAEIAFLILFPIAFLAEFT